MSDALNCRVIEYYQQTNYLKAKEFFEEALEVRLTIKDTSAIAESYGNIGQAYRSLGDMDKNIEYLKKGLDLDLEMGAKDGIAIGYGNLGLYYSNVGDLEKSVEYYFKALKILEEKNDQSGIASLYDNLVTSYASQKDFDQALSYTTKSLNIRLELGQGSKIADSVKAAEAAKVKGALLLAEKADKQPIGKYDAPKPYTTHTIELKQGDSF